MLIRAKLGTELIGLKMVWLNEVFGGKFPIGWSLAIIAGLIGGSILISPLVDRAKKSTMA